MAPRESEVARSARMAPSDSHERASLAEHDGLPLRSPRLAHPVDLVRWLEDGLLKIDADSARTVLTAAGRATGGN